MQKILCSSVLVLALCGSVLAGDMSAPPLTNGGVTGTPSAPQTSGETAAEDSFDTDAPVPAADGITYGDYADGITAAALYVLNSALALL